MKHVALLVAIVQLAGCGLGAGSAFVGQWRPRDNVDFEACLVDDGGRCIEHKQVTTPVPGRRFWGVILTYPTVGAAAVTQDGISTTRLRLSPSIEVLRGSGRFAFGVRAGAQLDIKAAQAWPVAALGHVSLTDRLSLHLGGGYLPYARQLDEKAYLGAQALAGVQLALSRVRSETYIVVTVEGDVTWIAFEQRYRSNGVTGHLGIFF